MRVSKFLKAITIGLLLIVVGCSQDEINKEKINKTVSYLPEFVFEKDVFPPSPNGIIKVDGNDYEMRSGNFRWEKGNMTTETDAASPNQIAEHFEAIEVKSNSKVNIEVEQNPKLSIFLWEDEGRTNSIQLDKNQLTMPEKEGRHIYEVRAEWEKGEVSYTFVVEVK